MIRMAVIDSCYPRNAQVIEQDARSLKIVEYPEPVTENNVEQDKFVDFSLTNPRDFEFVGYQQVPVFRMKEDAAVQFANQYAER